MEKKSARFLALLLAFIMIGSVLAMLPRGTQKSPEREVKYEFDKFDEWLMILPAVPDQVIYIDTDTEDRVLLEYIDSVIAKNWNPNIFTGLRIDSPVKKMLIAGYRDGLLYMVDINKTRVFYTGDPDVYKGFNVKFGQGVMLVPEISPFIIGTAPHSAAVIDTVISEGGGTYKLISNYTPRIPGNFNVMFMFYGEAAEMLISGGNLEDYTDFYLEGVRVNGTIYEKVVAIHFTGSGGFANFSVNDTIPVEYYDFTNFEDGFSVAIMHDYNLTKLMEAQPRLRPIISFEPVEE